MSQQAGDLVFSAEGVDGKPFDFAGYRGNRRTKIILVIDAMIAQDNIRRLQKFTDAVTWMMNQAPLLQHAIEIVPFVSLRLVAQLAAQDTVRQVIGQVLTTQKLSVTEVSQMVVLDWNGDGIESIRLSIARAFDARALEASSVQEFEKHSLWMIVTNENTKIQSVLFAVPTPNDVEEFAGFVDDVIAAAPTAEAQQAIASVYSEYYAQHPL